MPDYSFESTPPTLEEYLRLRRDSGLTPKRADQAAGALANSWAWHRAMLDRTTVAMGRVVGDGGWYFLIADMATLPEHQHRGLGATILDHLVDRIRRDAPPGAYITLLADPPGQRLYARSGFTEPTNGSVTMHRLLDS